MNGTLLRGRRVPFKNLMRLYQRPDILAERSLRQFPTVTHEFAVQALEEQGVITRQNRMRFC